jgi:hypothetical protein
MPRDDASGFAGKPAMSGFAETVLARHHGCRIESGMTMA